MPSTEDTAKKKSEFGLDFAKFLASKYGNISGPETLSPTFDSMISSWGRPTTPIGFKYPPITPPGKPSGEGFNFSGFEGEGGGKNSDSYRDSSLLEEVKVEQGRREHEEVEAGPIASSDTSSTFLGLCS